jgi:hypothetical protein
MTPHFQPLSCFLPGLADQYKIICKEHFPWYTSPDILSEALKYNQEDEWENSRSLVYFDCDFKILDVLVALSFSLEFITIPTPFLMLLSQL